MPTENHHPAWRQFIAPMTEELIFAQVLITRAAGGYELRHAADRATARETLRALTVAELRSWAQSAATGAFRPLKSAPNLRPGWRADVTDEAELETALSHLYPGALADWWAAQSEPPPVTSYREFTNRQTGMYRLTQMLDDAQAGRMIRACCHEAFCLKRRLWTVNGLPPDTADGKSLIPCLEPCALLLEFARKAMRLEQADTVQIKLSADDVAVLRAALLDVGQHPSGATREGDFNAPENPRRIRLLLEKLAPFFESTRTGGDPA